MKVKVQTRAAALYERQAGERQEIKNNMCKVLLWMKRHQERKHSPVNALSILADAAVASMMKPRIPVILIEDYGNRDESPVSVWRCSL